MVIKNDVDTRNEAWAKDKSSFGHRMLAKMGWEEGKGLGKNKQGTVNNLRAVKRAESLGIGATTDLHGDEGFHVTKNNFLGVLERLKQEHDTGKMDKKKKKKRKKKDSEGLILAQNRVNAGHARKMRESKDLSKKSKEDMAAIFGMKVDAYTANSSVWGKLKQAQSTTPSVQEQVVRNDDDIKKTLMEQEDTHIISTDPSPVSSDTDIIKQDKEEQTKKLKKESKKKKKSKKSDKSNQDETTSETKKDKKKKKKRKLKDDSIEDGGESKERRKKAKKE